MGGKKKLKDLESLEKRTCINGCGLEFKTLKSSPQRNCSRNCSSTSKKSNKPKRTMSSKDTDLLSSISLKDHYKAKINLLKNKTELKITLEGDYFSVSGTGDKVLYISDLTMKKILTKALNREFSYISKRDLLDELCHGEHDTFGMIPKWIIRMRNLLTRNFGGVWLIEEGDFWYLLSKEIKIFSEVKETYMSGKASLENPIVGRIKNELPKKTVAKKTFTDTEKEQIFKGVEEKIALSQIADLVGTSPYQIKLFLRKEGVLLKQFLDNNKTPTESEHNLIVKMSQLRKNNFEIAEALSKTEKWVSAYKKAKGITDIKEPFMFCRIREGNIFIDGMYTPISPFSKEFYLFKAFFKAKQATLSSAQIFRILFNKGAKSYKSFKRIDTEMINLRSKIEKNFPDYNWLLKVEGRSDKVQDFDSWKLADCIVKLTEES